jgi:hypothetical protein
MDGSPPWRRLGRGLFAAAWVVLLGGLAWRDLAPSGQRHVTSDLVRRQPYLSLPYPEGRLAAPEASAGGWQQRVLAEPLYVDVRLPRRLDEVRLRLWYRARGLPDPVVGLQVSVAPWRYDLKPFERISVDQATGWSVGEAVFPLERAASDAGQVRLLISAPRLAAATTGDLYLHRVDVTLAGPPLRPADAVAAVARRLRQAVPYAR